MGTASASTIPETITYNGNTATEMYRSSNYTSTLTSQASFDNYSPYQSGSTYYLIVKSGSQTTIGSACKVTTTTSGQNPIYQWSITATLTAGKYLSNTPKPIFKNFARLYAYTGAEQKYTPIISNKKYLLECWGASGSLANTYYYSTTSTYMPHPGKGGYTYATTTLTNNNALYVYVGSSQDRFNGGSWGDPAGADASHIATVSGNLPSLSSQRDKVLIVAGGAGGASDSFTSGYGGGSSGGDGITGGSGSVSPTGGTSSSGGTAGYQRFTSSNSRNFWGGAGTFGQGGAGWVKTLNENGTDITSLYSDPGGGGGGGWYGGGGAGSAGGGGGGSGYVKSGLTGSTIAGNQQVPNPSKHSTYSSGPYENVEYYFEGVSGKTYASKYGHAGNGYARITIKPYD